jgi:hypothetical protein
MADHARTNKRRDELVTAVVARLAGGRGAEDVGEDRRRALAERVVDAACLVTAPDDGETLTKLITLGPGGTGGGASVKPGNVLLKMNKLVVLTAKAVTSSVGVATHPSRAGVAARVRDVAPVYWHGVTAPAHPPRLVTVHVCAEHDTPASVSEHGNVSPWTN